MRAMPSPTSSTTPVSRESAWPPKSLICRCSTETISSGLNLMAAVLDDLVADVLEPGADAGVVEPVADAHHQPAQQVGVERRFQHRLLPQGLAQFADQPLLLLGRQGHGRAHLGSDPAAAL